MSIKTVKLDDISPDVEAIETISFAIGSDGYEIDLGEVNIEKLNKALASFIKHARPISVKEVARRATNGTAGNGINLAEVRNWAQSNGHSLGDRGRIPQEIIDKYVAAQTNK